MATFPLDGSVFLWLPCILWMCKDQKDWEYDKRWPASLSLAPKSSLPYSFHPPKNAKAIAVNLLSLNYTGKDWEACRTISGAASGF